MNNDFEELQIKIPNISTMLEDLGNYVINGTVVSVRNTNEYDYVKNYIYKLKADNKALNLLVDKLTAKEEKKDKWIKITTKYGGSVIVKTKDIDHVYYDHEEDTYNLYLKNKDLYYLLSKETYEQLTELLVENKENE
jgi:hypothetical protein